MEPIYGWRSVEEIPDGCCNIEVRLECGRIKKICSCDYWWMSADEKQSVTGFRFVENQND